MINIPGTLKKAIDERISLNGVVAIIKVSIIIEDNDFKSNMIANAGGTNSIYIKNGKHLAILLKTKGKGTLAISIKMKTTGIIIYKG